MKRSLTLVPALAVATVVMPKYAGYISAIIMIAVIIFLHELGHFLAAKWMGMPVSEFALGLPFGPFIRITVDSGSLITALITRRSCGELGLEVGSTVTAGVKATAIHVLADRPGTIQ